MGEIRLEKRVRRNFNIDKQVARNPPAPTAPPMAWDAQATAGWDPRRNIEVEMSSLPGNGTVALASYAFRLRYALSAAIRANGRHREERREPPERGAHIPRSSAAITGSAHLAGAGAFAHRAILGPGNLQLDATATQLFVERDAYTATHIRRPCDVCFALCRRCGPLDGGGRFVAMRGGMAIVVSAARRIAQDLVGGANELERLLGIGALVTVGVPYHRALTIREPDFLR